MKKDLKIILVPLITIVIVLSIPRKNVLWDGGSVEYKSTIYKITKVHRLANIGYYEGTEIEFLGVKIFDNTKLVNSDIKEFSFKAKVIECRSENTLLVKAMDSTELFKEDDEVIVHTTSQESYTNGMKLNIIFDGNIEESFPPQISSSKIEVIDN